MYLLSDLHAIYLAVPEAALQRDDFGEDELYRLDRMLRRSEEARRQGTDVDACHAAAVAELIGLEREDLKHRMHTGRARSPAAAVKMHRCI